jgi:hypothetical protein
LVSKLLSIGFVQSKVDECVFYHGNAIYVLYVDDSILAGPDPKELDAIVAKMKTVADLTVEGDLGDFLGVQIERSKDGKFILSQPQLIDSILNDLRLNDSNVTVKDVPASSSVLLSRHLSSDPFDDHFKYSSVVGKLNYLEQCTRMDISFAVHQLARFSANPRVPHGHAMKWLGRYLVATRDKGIIYDPKEQSFEVYCDADFAGNWDKEIAHWDVDTARSRSGYIIKYANCPLIWGSKLQSEIALSSCESEFICLSETVRQVIPLINLVKEIKSRGGPLSVTIPTVHCRVFEDNSGAIQIATVPKMRPRTKHINVKFHFFKSFVERGLLSVHKIHTSLQQADVMTKPLNAMTLKRLRKQIMGW